MRRRGGQLLLAAALLVTGSMIHISRLAADEKVYDNTLPGTVWIKSDLPGGQSSFGSGVLINVEKKWVVTNYHVVMDNTSVRVFFPQRQNGQLIAEREYYFRNDGKLGVTAKVISRDPSRDLAVVELSSLPKEARPIRLAPRSARQGQEVHVIGNPQGGALWVYTSGTVRQIYKKRWAARLGTGGVLNLHARVVETQLPINPGDSGGPVVNNSSELVGVVCSYDRGQQLVSTCIDVEEIKTILTMAEKGIDLVANKKDTSPDPLLTPSSPQGNAPPIKTPPMDYNLGTMLSKAGYYSWIMESDGVYRIRFARRNKTPHVYVDSRTEQFLQIETRRVWAIAKVFPSAPTGELAQKLLLHNHTRKVGAWEVHRLPTGHHWIVYCARIPANADPDTMRSVIEFVHAEADDFSRGVPLHGVETPTQQTLDGDWRATSTNDQGVRIDWSLTVRGGQMTVTADSGQGNPVTLSGTYSFQQGQLTLDTGSRRENLGRLTWVDAQSFIVDDGRLSLRFQRSQ